MASCGCAMIAASKFGGCCCCCFCCPTLSEKEDPEDKELLMLVVVEVLEDRTVVGDAVAGGEIVVDGCDCDNGK